LAKEGFATQKSLDDAREMLRAAEARFNSSQARLVRREVLSPATGTIQQVYFRSGEMVSGAKPVIALLPPGNIKLRFYVPEAALPRIHLGDSVRVQCDGCDGDITGRISFLSGAAEFTPPVIFSLEERAKMVFRVEARPQMPDVLRVGQPVSIAVLDSTRAASR
jgi:HlyD family secretion protein